MGVQRMLDEGMTSSPKNKNPPPRPLKQWPTTLRIRPREWSWDKMLVLPLPRPRTPAVEGEEVGLDNFWSYPHLATERAVHNSNFNYLVQLNPCGYGNTFLYNTHIYLYLAEFHMGTKLRAYSNYNISSYLFVIMACMYVSSNPTRYDMVWYSKLTQRLF